MAPDDDVQPRHADRRRAWHSLTPSPSVPGMRSERARDRPQAVRWPGRLESSLRLPPPYVRARAASAPHGHALHRPALRRKHPVFDPSLSFTEPAVSTAELIAPGRVLLLFSREGSRHVIVQSASPRRGPDFGTRSSGRPWLDCTTPAGVFERSFTACCLPKCPCSRPAVGLRAACLKSCRGIQNLCQLSFLNNSEAA
jgi:hypothetical protein